MCFSDVLTYREFPRYSAPQHHNTSNFQIAYITRTTNNVLESPKSSNELNLKYKQNAKNVVE